MKLIFALLFPVVAFCQSDTIGVPNHAYPSASTNWAVTFTSNPQSIVKIMPSDKVNLVEIDGPDGELKFMLKRDGTTELGKDYKPDAAAKQFWESLRKYMITDAVCNAEKPSTP